MTSPRRLMEGGAAMFAADMMNHKKVMEGKRDMSPFVMYILRVPVSS